MPSFDHELLVELFRHDGHLAVALLGAHAGIAVEHARVGVGSIDLSQVAPTEYRADAVVILYDRDEQPVTGVIVEVQRQVEPAKERAWPAYVANLHAKLACATILLVVAPSPAVAAWARRPIELGHPGFCLTPIVVGFEDVPRVRDRDAALHLPALAMLSVLAHPEQEIAEAAIAAIAQLPEEQSQLYLDVIMMALPEAIRQRLEVRMQGYQYRSDFARKYYGQGKEEGREEGREQGLRVAVAALARLRLEAMSEEEIGAIAARLDQHALTRLIVALGRAGNADEARAALEHAARPES